MAFVARLVVKAGCEAEFEKAQGELTQISRSDEPGTITYDFLKHREAPRTYVVYSTFRDEAAFQEHMEAPSHDRLVPPILECLAEEMDLQFFDAVQ